MSAARPDGLRKEAVFVFAPRIAQWEKAALASEPMRLGRDERRELVEYLSGEGISARSIAPIVGVTPKQVTRDIAAGVTNVTPAQGPSDPLGTESIVILTGVQIDPTTGEITEAEPEPTRTVTGLDGKTYTVPAAPRKPNRRPITDAAAV